MRKFLQVISVCSFTMLSSCATTGGGGLTQDQLNALVQQIQAFTASACAFQPATAGVVALITALFPATAPFALIVNTVGDAICKAPVVAVSVKGARHGVTIVTRIVPTNNGPVKVTGATYGAIK